MRELGVQIGHSSQNMQRHFAVAYILAVIELLIGCSLAFAGLRFFPELFRHPSPSTHLDDYLALAALAVTGTATVLAAAVTIFHGRVSYGVIRTARIGAAVSDVWMLLTGVGMWVISRRRGGDWAGLGVLGALLFFAVGTPLLVLSLITLRYIRRMHASRLLAKEPNTSASHSEMTEAEKEREVQRLLHQDEPRN
jgi:hypothetical protein